MPLLHSQKKFSTSYTGAKKISPELEDEKYVFWANFCRKLRFCICFCIKLTFNYLNSYPICLTHAHSRQANNTADAYRYVFGDRALAQRFACWLHACVGRYKGISLGIKDSFYSKICTEKLVQKSIFRLLTREALFWAPVLVFKYIVRALKVFKGQKFFVVGSGFPIIYCSLKDSDKGSFLKKDHDFRKTTVATE